MRRTGSDTCFDWRRKNFPPTTPKPYLLLFSTHITPTMSTTTTESSTQKRRREMKKDYDKYRYEYSLQKERVSSARGAIEEASALIARLERELVEEEEEERVLKDVCLCLASYVDDGNKTVSRSSEDGETTPSSVGVVVEDDEKRESPAKRRRTSTEESTSSEVSSEEDEKTVTTSKTRFPFQTIVARVKVPNGGGSEVYKDEDRCFSSQTEATRVLGISPGGSVSNAADAAGKGNFRPVEKDVPGKNPKWYLFIRAKRTIAVREDTGESREYANQLDAAKQLGMATFQVWRGIHRNEVYEGKDGKRYKFRLA